MNSNQTDKMELQFMHPPSDHVSIFAMQFSSYRKLDSRTHGHLLFAMICQKYRMEGAQDSEVLTIESDSVKAKVRCEI